MYHIKFYYFILATQYQQMVHQHDNKKKKVEFVKHAVQFHQRLEYDLNQHGFNIINSFAYASASVHADENYQYPSVKGMQYIWYLRTLK